MFRVFIIAGLLILGLSHCGPKEEATSSATEQEQAQETAGAVCNITNYEEYIGANLSGDVAKTTKLIADTGKGCQLQGADLSGKDLTSADLRLAGLQNANLQHTKLNSANLLGAQLQGADIRGADLNAVNDNGADFTGAKYNDATNLPGFDWLFLRKHDLVKE